MHELGILRQIVRTVERIAEKNRIRTVKHITLEVGLESGIVPQYMDRLFPLSIDSLPLMKNAELRIQMVPGKGLVIKDLGYEKQDR